MSTVTLEIRLDNAAFEGSDFGPELARILVWVSNRVQFQTIDQVDDMALRDINGNRVGSVKFEIDGEDGGVAE